VDQSVAIFRKTDGLGTKAAPLTVFTNIALFIFCFLDFRLQKNFFFPTKVTKKQSKENYEFSPSLYIILLSKNGYTYSFN
jgi:hypothetical protein